jgi:hypothetical protein
MNPDVNQSKEFGAAPPLPGTEPSSVRESFPPTINPAEVEARHRDSVARYPELSLSSNEYVLEVIRRHPIGLLSIWGVIGFLVFVAILIVPLYSVNHDALAKALTLKPQALPGGELLVVPAFLLAALFLLGGWIATIVYKGNRFYLTDESIVQFVQTSLFSTQQQVVNLINVEDVSSQQTGILGQLLNYGALRVSTQGEETIYHFMFVANPKRVVNTINEATEQAIKRIKGHGGYPVSEL